MNERVNHPAHYAGGGLEVIDAIEAWGLGFHLGNVVKYVARCDSKGDALEDLRKARWYLDREIERREQAPEGSADCAECGDGFESQYVCVRCNRCQWCGCACEPGADAPSGCRECGAVDPCVHDAGGGR